jgi:hypothetical protein
MYRKYWLNYTGMYRPSKKYSTGDIIPLSTNGTDVFYSTLYLSKETFFLRNGIQADDARQGAAAHHNERHLFPQLFHHPQGLLFVFVFFYLKPVFRIRIH